MNRMTQRFKRDTWHPRRVKMDEMEPGDVEWIPVAEYTIAAQSKHRLRDAYLGEREWTVTKKDGKVRVERIK